MAGSAAPHPVMIAEKVMIQIGAQFIARGWIKKTLKAARKLMPED